MNEPPLDRTESSIDIFVLSISESVAPQITELLEENGYRVTVFIDGTRLLETLHEGKPNLLICDTTSIEDGFEVCRRIKADNDLWVIPVLIFTSASTLTDLLNVLDCNADNFLAFPSDLPYRLSLIETMLTTPVERQTPDLIKTQFKINHDDRIYVVSASRRKILEFLLSSFETAVNKSSELSELKMEIQKLTESAETLEESITEHTCVIDLLNASVKQKEQKIITLTAEGAEKERAIRQKTGEIRQISGEREADKALIALRDENIRSLIREKEENESFHQSETDALREQVSGLLTQIDTAKTGLGSVQRDLEEEKTHCLSLEGTLHEIIAKKDLAEKTLTTLIPEHEQLKSAFEAGKNRAILAEEEFQAAIQAKTQSEQGLNDKIAGLDHALQQKDADLTRLKEELEHERTGRISMEEQQVSLRQELDAAIQARTQSEQGLDDKIAGLGQALQQKDADLTRLKEELEHERTGRISMEEQQVSLRRKSEQSELSLQSGINTLNEHLNTLQEEYRTACTALETKEGTIKSLERNLAESVAEKERDEENASANQVLYDTTLAQLNNALAEGAATRSALETDLAAAKKQARIYADELDQVSRGSVESGQQVQSLAGELEQVRETLEKKESLIKSLRENLAGAVSEKENTEERVKADMESYKTTFIRLKHDLDETLASRRTLEKDLAAAKTQGMASAKELTLATLGKDQAEQQIRLLADELERVKAEFNTERSLHRTSDENLEAIEQTRQRFEQDLRISVEELNSLNARLEDEQKLRLIAEEKTIAAAMEQKRLEGVLHALTEERDHQEHERALKIQNLKKDLDTVSDLQKSLEEEVSVLNGEKLKAEQKVQALSLELEQARTALADEWEDHMTSDERLAAAELERQRLQQSLSPSYPAGSAGENVHEIVAKEPDLPVTIDPARHSLERVMPYEEQALPVTDDKPASMEPSTGEKRPGMGTRSQNFSGIEDLFEEDESASAPAQDEEPGTVRNDEELSSETPAPGAGKEDEGYVTDEEDAIEPEEEPEMAPGISEDSGGAIPGPAFPINRMQWLGLIKWAHHSDALSRDQRLQIIRMGRLIQRNRKLTREQEDQVREMVALVQALGYRPA